MLYQIGSKSSTESSFPLAEGTVDIWTIRLDQDFVDAKDQINVLSNEEIQRAGRYVFEKDRDRFIRCRRALRKILAGYLGVHPRVVEFTCNQYGKPYIDENVSPVRFNVSHSCDIALIAVTMTREIGVDIEFVDPRFDVLSVASSVFSDAEVERLKLLPTAEQSKYFYTAWTHKEAILKAIGKGFSTPLDQQRAVSEMDKDGDVIFTSSVENKIVDWSLTSLDAPDNYVAALSVGNKISGVSYRQISDICDEFALRFAA